MLPVVKTFHQGKTQYCVAFSIAHALEVFLSKDFKDVIISPYGVVIATWRWKYLKIWGKTTGNPQNKASSTEETFYALKHYGIRVKYSEGRLRYRPTQLTDINKKYIREYLKKGIPVIATIGNAHAICIVEELKNHFKIIDSLSSRGYRVIPMKNIFNYQIII